MPSPNRDKYRPRGGKMLDEDDSVFDLTAWIKSVGVTILTAFKIKNASGTIINPATEEKQDSNISALDTVGISNTSDVRQNPATIEKQDDIISAVDDKSDDRFFSGDFLNNEIYGSDMNVDVGFTGTPDKIHDGIDLTLWLASALAGTWDFNSTTHAKQGVSTVIDYSALAGVTVTIQGTNITNTVLTEGVDWTAGTSNEVTATDLASAIDGVDGVSASANGAIIIVIADNSITQADITNFISNDLTNLPTTAQSVDASLTTNGDEVLFKKSSTIDMSNFTVLRFDLLITKWSIIKGNEIQVRARNNGIDVGNPVNLSDFFDVTNLNVWQALIISKSNLGLDDDIIDEFVFETISNIIGEPNAPDYYLDIIQLEESGAPVTFTFAPPAGTTFYLEQTTFESVVASSDVTPLVSYNKFIELPRLDNGINTVARINGVTLFSTGLHSNAEILALPNIDLSVFVDGTDKIFQFKQNTEGVNLNGDTEDFFGVTVNDDLSSLKFFRYFIKGRSKLNS